MTALDIFTYSGQRLDFPGDRLYAIELGDMVKVGRSSSIDKRIRTHAATAHAFGARAGRVWIGEHGSALAETALINACGAIAEPRAREYFPIPLERVIEIASSLDWADLKVAAQESALRANEFAEDVKAYICGGYADPYAVAEKLVAAWREFDVDGYKEFLVTKADWRHVALILTQWLVGHSADALMERAEIEALREMWAEGTPT